MERKSVTILMIFLCVSFIVTSLPGTKAAATGYAFSVDPALHDKYGLTYPVTYEFSIPSGSSGLTAWKRFTLDENWVRINEKTSDDLFSGIEAVRFDYTNNIAYVSISFASYSDSIYVYLGDSSGNQIPTNYLGIAPYYDNRRVTVVFSLDDLGASPTYGVDNYTACSVAFADAKVWLTGGVVTFLVPDQGTWPIGSWPLIQECVNRGYFEVSSHSRTHPNLVPYTSPPNSWAGSYDDEIRGSRDDILGNLTGLPYSNGTQGYVWSWIEPSGVVDGTIQQKLGQYGYLVSRETSVVQTSVPYPHWNSTSGIYDLSTTSVDIDGQTLAYINGVFDNVYNGAGGIYHVWGHIGKSDWTPGGLGYEHIQHIAGKKDVWYVGFGALYVYAFTRDHVQTMSATINPTQTNMESGQSQMFTSSVSVGSAPYTYQWYLNGSQVPNATGSVWTFKPANAGTYIVFLRITDNLNAIAQSNDATVNVKTPMTVTINAPELNMYFGQTQTFNSTITGDTAPYTYQWYLNDTAIPDATNNNYTFTPNSDGQYKIYLNVTDGFNFMAESNVSNVIVCSVYLTLSEGSSQAPLVKGESLTLTVDVLNQLDPPLASSLTLNVNGPGNYGYFDVQPISVKAGTEGEYTFDWTVPNIAGTYIIEVGLAPAQLTAYDSIWLKVT